MQQPSLTKAAILRSNKLKLIWGIIALAAPTVIFIVVFVLYAVVNFILSSNPESSDSPVRVFANVILFIVGALTTITWLPGIIVGIILIATRKPVPSQ